MLQVEFTPKADTYSKTVNNIAPTLQRILLKDFQARFPQSDDSGNYPQDEEEEWSETELADKQKNDRKARYTQWQEYIRGFKDAQDLLLTKIE